MFLILKNRVESVIAIDNYQKCVHIFLWVFKSNKKGIFIRLFLYCIEKLYLFEL